MTFASSLESLTAWQRSRLQSARFVPLAALLTWAALSAGGVRFDAIFAFLLSAALVAQFRLWDDLVDRARDGAAHPDRALVRATSTVPFDCLLGLIAAVNAIALFALRGAAAALGLVVLSAAAACWYRWHRSRGLTHALVLHLKYPAFVLLLAPVSFWPLAGAAIAYATLVGFELLDEPGSRSSAQRRHVPFAFAAIGLAVITWGEYR